MLCPFKAVNPFVRKRTRKRTRKRKIKTAQEEISMSVSIHPETQTQTSTQSANLKFSGRGSGFLFCAKLCGRKFCVFCGVYFQRVTFVSDTNSHIAWFKLCLPKLVSNKHRKTHYFADWFAWQWIHGRNKRTALRVRLRVRLRTNGFTALVSSGDMMPFVISWRSSWWWVCYSVVECVLSFTRIASTCPVQHLCLAEEHFVPLRVHMILQDLKYRTVDKSHVMHFMCVAQ